MASPVPAKSQPLHNFSLPHLKWKNHRSGRSRLSGETSSSSPPHRSPSTPWRESPPPPVSYSQIPSLRQSSPSYVSRRPSPLHKQSPMRDSESESEPSCAVSKGIEKHVRKPSSAKPTKSFDSSKGKRSNKICIRFRKNSSIKHEDGVPEENHSSTPVDNAVASATAEEEESLPKIWNLRPRRPPMNHKQFNGGLPKIGSSSSPENRPSQINYHMKEASEAKNNDHNNFGTIKKQKFSIALSRHEIEEDIFAWTGSKPSRRPKKRPRTVQKQLDTLFPGLWLGSITADSYKVSEAPPKV